MQLKSNNNLIGDLLGMAPMLIDLSKREGGLKVYQSLDEGKWIYPFIAHQGIELVDYMDEAQPFFEPDISEAFAFSHIDDLQMTQCWHHQCDMLTPEHPIKADLKIPDIDVPVYDWVFAPFGRSAPDDQKWDLKNWYLLAKQLQNSGYSVAVIGNGKLDRPYMGMSYAYVPEMSRPMVEVMNILKKARYGCVSIVTGISQLCFHLGVKNYVLSNQGGLWGQNPDGVLLQTYIPRITVDEVLTVLRKK